MTIEYYYVGGRLFARVPRVETAVQHFFHVMFGEGLIRMPRERHYVADDIQ